MSNCKFLSFNSNLFYRVNLSYLSGVCAWCWWLKLNAFFSHSVCFRFNFQNILEKFNPGARQLISAGKAYLKALHGKFHSFFPWLSVHFSIKMALVILHSIRNVCSSSVILLVNDSIWGLYLSVEITVFFCSIELIWSLQLQLRFDGVCRCCICNVQNSLCQLKWLFATNEKLCSLKFRIYSLSHSPFDSSNKKYLIYFIDFYWIETVLHFLVAAFTRHQHFKCWKSNI